MKPAFLLIHSPLVGPYTWTSTAEALQQAGYVAIVPRLTNNEISALPYKDQHIHTISQAYHEHLLGLPIILVAHSGAGMLLPLAGQAIGTPAGYIFVDAGLPHNNKSRLDRFPSDEAERFRQSAINGYLPMWSEEALATVLPDRPIRHEFVMDLRPTPITVYEEKISVPDGWPNAHCAYLSFSKSTSYADDIKQARDQNWPYAELDGYHFHMLVDPTAVAKSLIDLSQQITTA